MKHRVPFRIWLILIQLGLLVLPSLTLQAQVPGLTETFDDPTLPGWEYSPGVTVVDGALRIEPGNFAFHGGEWRDLTLTLRLRRSGVGEVMVNYRASDSGTYRIVLGGDMLALHHEMNDAITELGLVAPLTIPTEEWFQLGVAVTDGEHTITLDGERVLTASDPKPLLPGGIGFEAVGEITIELDDLTVTPSGTVTASGTAPPPDVEVSPEEPLAETNPPSEQSPPPAPSDQSLTWVRTGGPPGGLGYDIRYNFADFDTWYVTDAWGGLHISTDNGLTWQESSSGIPGQLGPTGDAVPIFSLTVDPLNPQIMWAGTDRTGHIYRSTDGGRTWEERDNGVSIKYDGLTFRGFTVDPRSSDIVYAMGETTDESLGGPSTWMGGTGGVVYKTTNGGAQWEVIWDGGMRSSLARYLWIDPRDPNVLYVSTGIFDRGAVGESNSLEDPFGGLGVLKSTDGGQTWRELNQANGLRMLYIGSLFMHPDDPDVLLAAAGHIFEPDTLPYIERLMGEGQSSPTGIYRSSDGGEHWTQTLATFDIFSAVELCPSNPDIGYAGSPGAIYRSEDAGQTWTLVSGGESGWGPPGVQVGFPIDMQCDPRDPNRIFVNNYGGGNFLSEDGGRTWQNASQGYTGERTFSVAVDPDHPGRVYAAGFGGIWRSDNGGTTWIGLFYPPPDYMGFEVVAADPSRSGHVLSGKTGIIESAERGESWALRWSPEQIRAELPEDVIGGQSPGAIVFAPSDPTTVYVGFGNEMCVTGHEQPTCAFPGLGIIVSHDGGTSWQRAVDDNLRDLSVIDVAVDSGDAQVVYAATGIGLFKSMDGGENWTSLPGLPEELPVRTVAVSPADTQRVLAGVEGWGIYRSADGGATWQQSSAGLEINGSLHDIVFDPTNPQVIYTSDTFSGVYRSVDGGGTWTKINNGLRTRAAMGLALSVDGQHLYVGTFGEGVFRLDLSGTPPEAVQPGAQPSTPPATPPESAQPTAALEQPAEPSDPQAGEESTQPTEAPPAQPPDSSTEPEPSGGGGFCGGAAALPLALVGLAWFRRRR